MATAIEHGENPMSFKKKLAHTITMMYHSADAATAAELFFEKTVQQKELPDEMPVIHISDTELTALELLTRAFPDQSKTELKRLIEQGAVLLLPSEQKVIDPYASIQLTDGMVVKLGKRRYCKIQL